MWAASPGGGDITAAARPADQASQHRQEHPTNASGRDNGQASAGGGGISEGEGAAEEGGGPAAEEGLWT